MDLVDIKVTGYDPFDPELGEGGAYGEVNLQTVTDYGFTDESYFWNDFIEYDYDGEGSDRTWKGWYADGSEEVAQRGDLEFAPGEGFFLFCESYDFPYALQSAGKVLTAADQPVLLNIREKLVANPTPVTVYLKQCYVSGYDPFDPESGEGGAYGEVNAQTVTDYGFTDGNYFWNDFIEYDYDGEGSDRTWYGWYADGSEEVISATECPIAAGEGLFIFCESYDFDYTFVWPKVVINN